MELKFVNTFTVADFKANHEIATIDIVKSPKTGKLFFSAYSSKKGTITGPVGENFKECPMVSEVIGDGGEVFYLLHKKGASSEENIVDKL